MKKRSKKSSGTSKSKENNSKSSKKESENNKKVRSIAIRYLLLVIAAVPGIAIFYYVFTPLTTYPIYWILGIFYDALLFYNRIPIILLNDAVPIELVKACIAGSAYYLLFVLNLSTPGIKMDKRIKAVVFSFVVFLIANIIRIIILSALAVAESGSFDITHTVFWYGLSTVLVVGIWFAEVKIFKIHKIPIYSDLKFLYKEARKRR